MTYNIDGDIKRQASIFIILGLQTNHQLNGCLLLPLAYSNHLLLSHIVVTMIPRRHFPRQKRNRAAWLRKEEQMQTLLNLLSNGKNSRRVWPCWGVRPFLIGGGWSCGLNGHEISSFWRQCARHLCDRASPPFRLNPRQTEQGGWPSAPISLLGKESKPLPRCPKCPQPLSMQWWYHIHHLDYRYVVLPPSLPPFLILKHSCWTMMWYVAWCCDMMVIRFRSLFFG